MTWRLSLAALALFLPALSLLQPLLSPLTLGDHFPSLGDAAALAYLFLLLAVVWEREARIHDRHTAAGRRAFVLERVRLNASLVLPWCLFNLGLDLALLLVGEDLERFLESGAGDLALLVVFALLLLLFYPPLLIRLWGCGPLPRHPRSAALLMSCRRLGFNDPVRSWPLSGGRALTAGVVGLAPRLRAMLITPALLEALDPEALEAVAAHEIGHVRRGHMLLYLLLLAGLGHLAAALTAPALSWLLVSPLFPAFLELTGLDPGTVAETAGGLAALVIMLALFRYLFGWFMRNFERQADLYAFRVQGRAAPMIRAFETIALLSGNIRDEPSWHHFSIASRVRMLERCQRDPGQVRRHDRRLALALAGFLVLALGLPPLLERLPQPDPGLVERRAILAMVEQALRDHPGNPQALLARAEILASLGHEAGALEAYEEAISRGAGGAELYNNLAWLLITARDPALRDPVRALDLAEKAAALRRESHVLDTLAAALAANGRMEEALAAQEEAVAMDREGRQDLRQRLEAYRRARRPR